MDKLIRQIGQCVHQLEKFSAQISNTDDAKSNYMMGFTPEIVQWLFEIAFHWSEKEGKKKFTIQQVTLSILEEMKAAYELEKAAPKKAHGAKKLADQLTRIALDLASRKKDMRVLTIRFSPQLATWLADMANVQMKVTKQKNITAQGAALTLVMLAYEKSQSGMI